MCEAERQILALASISEVAGNPAMTTATFRFNISREKALQQNIEHFWVIKLGYVKNSSTDKHEFPAFCYFKYYCQDMSSLSHKICHKPHSSLAWKASESGPEKFHTDDVIIESVKRLWLVVTRPWIFARVLESQLYSHTSLLINWLTQFLLACREEWVPLPRHHVRTQ